MFQITFKILVLVHWKISDMKSVLTQLFKIDRKCCYLKEI